MENVVREDEERKHRLQIASKPFRRMVLSSLQSGLHEATPSPLHPIHFTTLPPKKKKTCFHQTMRRNRGKDPQHSSSFIFIPTENAPRKLQNVLPFYPENVHNPEETASSKNSSTNNSSSTRSKRRRRSSSRGKPVVGTGNGDAGSSYTPAKAAYPPTETHKKRGEDSGFPCTDSFLFVAVVFCCCLLLVSMQRDLYDRMTGEALYQQTRICWDEARSTADFFLILPFPSTLAPSTREKERGREWRRERVYESKRERERERERECVCVCERVCLCVSRSLLRLFPHTPTEDQLALLLLSLSVLCVCAPLSLTSQ